LEEQNVEGPDCRIEQGKTRCNEASSEIGPLTKAGSVCAPASLWAQELAFLKRPLALIAYSLAEWVRECSCSLLCACVLYKAACGGRHA